MEDVYRGQIEWRRFAAALQPRRRATWSRGQPDAQCAPGEGPLGRPAASSPGETGCQASWARPLDPLRRAGSVHHPGGKGRRRRWREPSTVEAEGRSGRPLDLHLVRSGRSIAHGGRWRSARAPSYARSTRAESGVIRLVLPIMQALDGVYAALISRRRCSQRRLPPSSIHGCPLALMRCPGRYRFFLNGTLTRRLSAEGSCLVLLDHPLSPSLARWTLGGGTRSDGLYTYMHYCTAVCLSACTGTTMILTNGSGSTWLSLLLPIWVLPRLF